MKYSDLQHKSSTELQRQLTQLQEQLRHRRFQVAEGQHADVREIRELRRDIARVQTKLRQSK